MIHDVSTSLKIGDGTHVGLLAGCLFSLIFSARQFNTTLQQMHKKVEH